MAAVRHCLQEATTQMFFLCASHNVSFLFCLHHSFLNPFSLSRLPPSNHSSSLLVLSWFSNNHSSTLHSAKVHLDFFLPNSFHAPFSPGTFITSFFSPKLTTFHDLFFTFCFFHPPFTIFYLFNSFNPFSFFLCLLGMFLLLLFSHLPHWIPSLFSFSPPSIFLHCLVHY